MGMCPHPHMCVYPHPDVHLLHLRVLLLLLRWVQGMGEETKNRVWYPKHLHHRYPPVRLPPFSLCLCCFAVVGYSRVTYQFQFTSVVSFVLVCECPPTYLLFLEPFNL